MSKDNNLNNENEVQKDIINEETKNENQIEFGNISDEELGFINDKEEDNNSKEDEKSSEKKPKNIKTIAVVTIASVLCLGLGYTLGKDAGRGLPATHKNYSNNKVIATVGESKITEEQLKYKMEPVFYMNGIQQMTKDQIMAYEESMIDYMTTTEVLYLAGIEDKTEVTEEEAQMQYDSLMQSLQAQMGMTEEEYLNQFKISKEYIKADLKKELIASKYMSKISEVSEEEAKNYYDKNKDEFAQVQASHILIQTTDEDGNPLSEEEKANKKKEAEDLLNKIKAGESFEDLAKKYSQDTSAVNGGDLGSFSKGQMVKEFENAAFSLEIGQVTDNLVETQYGYHIIKKTGETENEFDTVKEDLVKTLSYEKQNNAVDNLIEKYNVEVKNR